MMLCKKCKYITKNGDVIERTPNGNVCPNCGNIGYMVKMGSSDGKTLHPLLNPESKHYSMIDGVEAIERMEQMYSIEDLMAWAKLTAMKYRLRIVNKDDVVKEAKKIATFEAYYEYLEGRLHDC